MYYTHILTHWQEDRTIYLPKLIDYRANDITQQEQDDINPIPSQTVWEIYCCPTDLNTLLNDNKISVLFYEWIQES